MAEEAGSGEVRRQHRFERGRVERYLSGRLPGFPRQPAGALAVRQYSSGQSDPTFYLQKGGQAYVLRKKPHGPLLPGAHKVDREYRVQKALFSAGFPVLEPLLYCSDVSVIGTEFYVMQHVQVALVKVVVPRAVLKVVDCAIQVCGRAGVSQDLPLAFMFAQVRTLRLADGPDEVHLSTIARWELLDQSKKLTAKM